MTTILNVKKEEQVLKSMQNVKNNDKVLMLTDNVRIIPRSEYTRALRKHLPEECFKPDTMHIFHYLTSMAVFLGGMYIVLNTPSIPLKALVSIVMGIALASLTFILHDLQHGSIIASRKISYPIAISIGLFNLFPPLFWQRIHNLHHSRTGDFDDPDRSYIKAEEPQSFLDKFIYRTRISSESISPIVSLFLTCTGFFWYFLGNVLSVFDIKFDIFDVKEKKKYARTKGLFKGKLISMIFIELFAILGFQAFLLFGVASGNFVNYLFMSVIPVAIAHFIAMMYIHTNHFLSPLTGPVDDPLLNSLSIKDYKISDKVFSNFSYHVEHHLFPAMGSVHYPKVRKLLLELYPERFQLVPTLEAIKMLFNTPRVYSDNWHLTGLNHKEVQCLMPKS